MPTTVTVQKSTSSASSSHASQGRTQIQTTMKWTDAKGKEHYALVSLRLVAEGTNTLLGYKDLSQADLAQKVSDAAKSQLELLSQKNADFFKKSGGKKITFQKETVNGTHTITAINHLGRKQTLTNEAAKSSGMDENNAVETFHENISEALADPSSLINAEGRDAAPIDDSSDTSSGTNASSNKAPKLTEENSDLIEPNQEMSDQYLGQTLARMCRGSKIRTTCPTIYAMDKLPKDLDKNSTKPTFMAITLPAHNGIDAHKIYLCLDSSKEEKTLYYYEPTYHATRESIPSGTLKDTSKMPFSNSIFADYKNERDSTSKYIKQHIHAFCKEHKIKNFHAQTDHLEPTHTSESAGLRWLDHLKNSDDLTANTAFVTTVNDNLRVPKAPPGQAQLIPTAPSLPAAAPPSIPAPAPHPATAAPAVQTTATTTTTTTATAAPAARPTASSINRQPPNINTPLAPFEQQILDGLGIDREKLLGSNLDRLTYDKSTREVRGTTLSNALVAQLENRFPADANNKREYAVLLLQRAEKQERARQVVAPTLAAVQPASIPVAAASIPEDPQNNAVKGATTNLDMFTTALGLALTS